MTTNSPNPVDGDVQALIEHIKEVLQEYEEHGGIGYGEVVYRTALAALTAKPYAYEFVTSGKKQVILNRVLPPVDMDEIIPLYTTSPAQLLRPVELPDETEMKWRDLALQFDGHRMQAISLLKMIINDAPDDQYLSVRNFLKSGPLPGEEVLRNRIAEIAEVQRLNATAQPVSDGWIRCTDSLPDAEGKYLVYETLNNRVNHDYWMEPEPAEGFWNHYDMNVTHWMPLPAALGGQDD